MIAGVIMAGGRGERLWPLSTPRRPKQFLRLFDERTMLQTTAERIAGWIAWDDMYVVTADEHTALVRTQLPALPAKNVIGEPVGRGTALCIGVAALLIRRKDPRAVMVVLPADHAIRNQDRFRQLLANATQIATSGTHLITLGITPDHPATGYGYIHAGARWEGHPDVFVVRAFTEKPSYELAKRFIASGDYYWNSGMFIWRVDTILDEIAQHLPQMYAGLMALDEHVGKPTFASALARVYADQPVLSIDTGVMEKSKRVLVIPAADIGWSDVGDWAAWARLLSADENGNVVQAPHIGIDTRNTVIFAQGDLTNRRPVATIGVEDIIIVDTDAGLLVMHKDRVQEVKKLFSAAAPPEERPEVTPP